MAIDPHTLANEYAESPRKAAPRPFFFGYNLFPTKSRVFSAVIVMLAD
jgi:hypothetical protein